MRRRPRGKAPKQPSESYAARRARGRIPISVELTEIELAMLDALRGARGDAARRDTIVAGLALLFATLSRPGA